MFEYQYNFHFLKVIPESERKYYALSIVYILSPQKYLYT